jgi:succinate dehydrogenase/fumarate reductase flavoprotein subunit
MTFNNPESFYEWSDDNLKEIENCILHRADTIDQIADAMGIRRGVLRATVDRWNLMCEHGEDEDAGRPPETMMPLRTPPYVYASVWPIVSNTHGGPRHDVHQRVLDVWGGPIPRLYAVGELGGFFGHLYLSSGNFAECFVGGWTAGRHAAGLEPHD